MKKWWTMIPAVALMCVLAIGCGGKDDEEETENGDSAQKQGDFACTACGAAAKEGHTCATDAEVCEGCELHKGSALCCKISEEDMAELKKGKRLCMACGHVAEDGHKCDATHEVCKQCGKHADSILCNCAEAAKKEETSEKSDTEKASG